MSILSVRVAEDIEARLYGRRVGGCFVANPFCISVIFPSAGVTCNKLLLSSEPFVDLGEFLHILTFIPLKEPGSY